MKNIKETPKALVDPVAEGSTEQTVANAQVADDEKLSSQSSNNDEGNPSVESEASKRIEEKPNLFNYEVLQGYSTEDIDLGEIPYDMSDPESWEKIAQICKDKEVDIVCYLDKPYKGCSTVVFRSSGEHLFIGDRVEYDAYDAFLRSNEVWSFSANLFGHTTQRLFYVWDEDLGCGHILFNDDENDTTENRVTSSESFGLYTSMLLEMPDLELF